MNDVYSAKYTYIPNDPTRYTVELSLGWVEDTTYLVIAAAYQNVSTWGISGINGTCIGHGLVPMEQGWGINNTAAYYVGSVTLASHNPYTYRTQSIQYTYLPKSAGWSASISVAWLNDKAAIESAAANGTEITVGGVTGYCITASFQPMSPETGVEGALYWQGSVQLLSYDPYTLKTQSIQKTYLPKGAGWSASISVMWLNNKSAIESAAANGTEITLGGVTGYCITASLSPMIPEIGEACGFWQGSVQLLSYNPYALRTQSIQKTYLPKNAGWSANVSVMWLDDKSTIESAAANGTVITVGGVTGYPITASFSPMIPEIGESCGFWQGNVQLLSYNPYALKTQSIQKTYLPKNTGYVANVSVVWLDNKIEAMGQNITLGGVTGYCVSASLSPMIPEIGESCGFWQGSAQLLSYDPYEQRITSIQISGPQGSVFRSINGTTIIQYGYTGQNGRDVHISLLWVPKTTVDTWISTSDTFSSITVGSKTLYVAPNNGIQAQSSIPEVDYDDAQYLNVNITGILTT